MALIAVTVPGLETAGRIRDIFPAAPLYIPPGLKARFPEASRGPEVQTFNEDLKTFVGTLFPRFDALIFVAAAGIVVRVIAPYLQDKEQDPAVVVVDDTGRFAVSLLSGHLGGANDLSELLARELGATAVITTSTDRHGLLAYDLLAARLGWSVENLQDLKKISTAQLEGKPVAVYADPNIQLEFPGQHLLLRREEELLPKPCHGLVLISSRRDLPRAAEGIPRILLRPRTLTAGVGCRRGTPAGAIVEAVEQALEQSCRVPVSLQQLASLEVKADEAGLLEAGEILGVPVRFFQKDDLRALEDHFDHSEFVHQAVGTGAVAEPCAYLGSGCGEMILHKLTWKKVTVALAEREIAVKWNGGELE